MEEGKKRLATLVGCNYFNTRNELRGCINDVVSMKELIVNRFGFDPEDVVVITDEPESEVKPTGANIRKALRNMVDKAETGDVLFFHYSGHGTLTPARSGHSKRDEAIVPVDFNLITDVDFRELVDRLPPGVSFTIISDSCHSGGLIAQEKEQIGPSASPSHKKRPNCAKMIPYEDILLHVSSLSGVDSEHIGDHLIDLYGDEDVSSKFSHRFLTSSVQVSRDDGILLSGCQTDETSADMAPEEEGGDKAYGAFSNSIQLVMAEYEGRISNRELVSRSRKLLGDDGFEQHPCLYCSDENAEAPFLWQKE